AVEGQDDGLVRVAVPELVGVDRELGHVRLQDRVAAHLPEDARVALAALFPRDHVRAADVLTDVEAAPALVDLVVLRGIVEPVGWQVLDSTTIVCAKTCRRGTKPPLPGIPTIPVSMWTLPVNLTYIPRPPISGHGRTSCVRASFRL